MKEEILKFFDHTESLVWTLPQAYDFLVLTETVGLVDGPTKEWWQIYKRLIIS